MSGPASESAPKIPATILTGFLGAGKTTLVNHILKDRTHGLKLAIIENEFGDVGIDDGVIKQASSEQVVEMMNGCICCTVRGDLVKVLQKLAKQKDAGELDFDYVLIETTGLADPAPVAQTFFVDPVVEKRFSLDGIITMIDAKHIIQHLDDEKEEGVENEAVEQVAFADRIILNKLDLVKEGEVEEVVKRLKAINSNAMVIKATNSVVDPKLLTKIEGFDLDRVLENEPEFLNTDEEHQHDLTVSSVSCVLDMEVNVTKLEEFIGELMRTKANDLFRYKGILAVKGMPTQFVFQGVHMLFNGGFGSEQWKEGQKRECKFVFIGRNLDKAALQARFEQCKAEDTLRFKKGDKVLANTGSFIPGEIDGIWVEGYPYCIKLEDGSKCFGPVDDDRYVKARA